MKFRRPVWKCLLAGAAAGDRENIPHAGARGAKNEERLSHFFQSSAMMSGVFRIQTPDQPMSFQNLRELLEARAGAAPEKVFLFSEADGRRFTYREFDAAVNRAANLLHAFGVNKGDVVSLLLPNGAEYVIAYFACFKLGALAGPVNSLLKTEEMAYVSGNSEAKVLLYHPDFEQQTVEMAAHLTRDQGMEQASPSRQLEAPPTLLKFADVSVADSF